VRRDISTAYVQIFNTALANWYGKGGHRAASASAAALQTIGLTSYVTYYGRGQEPYSAPVRAAFEALAEPKNVRS
jgi:hypothetical protein